MRRQPLSVTDSGRSRSMRTPVPDPRNRGFTMVEVMIAMVILAVGVLGATAGQIAALKLSYNSKAHGLALSLAEQQVEAFQATTLAEVIAEISSGTYPNDPNNPITLDPGGGTPIAFNRSWQIEQDTPEFGIARITVSVSWNDATTGSRTTRIQTFKGGQ